MCAQYVFLSSYVLIVYQQYACLTLDAFVYITSGCLCIYRVACVELAHSSLGDWKNISITHLIIIIKSEVSTFPIVVIFFRGCVSEMVVLSYSVIFYIYIPGTLGPCFHYWCSVYGICKWSDTLWPVGRVRLFADYTISLSSLCRLIWKHWTTKMLVRYMMPSVCLRLRQFSQLSLYSLYGAVCLQLTQFSCDDRENVYFILLSSSNRKYESLTIV